MFKRVTVTLAVLCLLVAAVPSSAQFANPPGTGPDSGWVDLVWERVVDWLRLRGPDAPAPPAGPSEPRSLSASEDDDGSGHIDPNG